MDMKKFLVLTLALRLESLLTSLAGARRTGLAELWLAVSLG